MPNKKYIVSFSSSERAALQSLIRKGRCQAIKLRNAHLLLNVDQGPEGPARSDQEVASSLSVSIRTLERLRQRFVENGLEASLNRKSRTPDPSRIKVDGEVEAHLIALSRSHPPRGRLRWTLRLLADKMVELQYIDSISTESVRKVLKKRAAHLAQQGLGDPSQTQRSFRLPDGTSPTSLQASL